jgi:hypothetical protein
MIGYDAWGMEETSRQAEARPSRASLLLLVALTSVVETSLSKGPAFRVRFRGARSLVSRENRYRPRRAVALRSNSTTDLALTL